MKNLFVHGCFDLSTLKFLQVLGVKNFSFDLRPRSTNLMSIDELQSCLKLVETPEIELIFENDSLKMVESYLDLLKKYPLQIYPQFRCHQETQFYQQLKTPWVWMFSPHGEWKEILHLPLLKKIILPIKWKTLYQSLPELWEIVDYKNIEVCLQMNSFDEVFSFPLSEDLLVGVDLDGSVQKGYRRMDLEKLKKLQILEGVL